MVGGAWVAQREGARGLSNDRPIYIMARAREAFLAWLDDDNAIWRFDWQRAREDAGREYDAKRIKERAS